MPLILPGNVATATASTTYDVANSVRMDGSGTYMTKTLGTPTDIDKYTFSFWCKRSKVGAQQSIFRSTNGAATNDSHVTFQADDTLRFEEYGGGATIGKLQTNQVFRDVSAWYHIVLVYDSGNATAGNRMRMYVNGAEVTSFGTDTNPSQNADSYFNKSGEVLSFGRTPYSGGSTYFDGYVAELVMCDGQAYAASDFGEFDSDSPKIWKPKDVSGLTFGNNGFYLDFEASGNLGNDANGGTDFSESGLAAIDQTTDTCTNNFCTFNPLIKQDHAFSEGNLKYTSSASDWDCGIATIPFSSGKWYMEQKITAVVGGIVRTGIGICDVRDQNLIAENEFGYKPSGAVGDSIGYNDNAVHKNDSAQSGSWGDMDNGDVAQMAVDLDNSAVYFGLNGTWGNSGDPTSGASKTGAIGFTAGQTYVSGAIGYGGGAVEQNWGNPVSALSSGNADANGYGDFEYAPPSGYYALCTKNLGEFGG